MTVKVQDNNGKTHSFTFVSREARDFYVSVLPPTWRVVGS